MAYTPTVWAKGDVITAEKLNKAEQGIADAGPVVLTVSYDEETYTYTLNASYNELYAIKDRTIIFVDEYTDGQTGLILTQIYRLGLLARSSSVYYASFIAATIEVEGKEIKRFTFTADDADADLTFVDD